MIKSVQNYYESLGSRLGYKFLLKGSQHFGYYPNPDGAKISEQEAQEHHHNILAKNLELKQGMNILDAGCGQGFVSCSLVQKHDVHITGIDITPYIIKQAKKRSKKLNVENRTKFILADYHRLPFKDNSFDRIYTVETLCHAQNLAQVIREFKRMLKPGGKIVCIEYLNKNKSEFTAEEQKIVDIIIKGTCSPSLQLLSKNSFQNILSESGFRGLKCTDISANFRPSLERFYRMAKIPYAMLKFLGIHKKFVNMVIAVESYKMAQKKLIGYAIYSAWK